MASDTDITHLKAADRQRRAYLWAMDTYGERARGARYQAFRFLEEALELVQTQGLTLEDFIRTARYVAERRVGDTKVEIGDVRVCLDILAENLGLSVDSCHVSCLSGLSARTPESRRAKDDLKVAAGLI